MAEITTTQQNTNTQANNCGCNTTPPDYVPTWPGCPPPPYPPYPPYPPTCPPPSDTYGTSNKTEFYGLPLWKASDVTSWLMQMNGAMIRIDSIMHNIALRTGINGIPEDLTNTVSQLCSEFNQFKVQLCEVTNDVATQKLNILNLTQQINNMQTDLSSMQLTATNLNTRMLTLETTQQNQANSLTMVQTDVNMMSKTINALQSALTQLQNSVNASITELQTGLKEVQNKLPDYLDASDYQANYIQQANISVNENGADLYSIKAIGDQGIIQAISEQLVIGRLPSFTLEYTGTDTTKTNVSIDIDTPIVSEIMTKYGAGTSNRIGLDINNRIFPASLYYDSTVKKLKLYINFNNTSEITGDIVIIPVSNFVIWLGGAKNSNAAQKSSEILDTVPTA